MSAAKKAVELGPEGLKEVDRFVQRGLRPSRNGVTQGALSGELPLNRRARLAIECAKLDPTSEQREAEEFLPSEVRWPE